MFGSALPTAPFLAGPDPHCAPEPVEPPTWDELLMFADDDFLDARRLSRPTVGWQRDQRIAAIERGIAHAEAAKRILQAEAKR